MKAVVKLNMGSIAGIEKAIERNLIKTADAIRTDLVQSETMPFDTGAMQNRSTFVDKKSSAKGDVYIVTDTPYARRNYFHPEFNFQHTHNANAGGEWFEPYISGDKKDYAKKVFAAFMRSSIGG